MSNSTNSLGFTFRDYQTYNIIRESANAFFLGSDSDFYSPNISVCFNTALNLAQYDYELMVIKYMYGSTKENVFNTTLFLQNVSDVLYNCIDGLENIYVYQMYRFELFGNDLDNVFAGFLQNLLGNIITINRIFNQVVEFN